ncbi:hypothetical protein C8E89_1511 [Mycolicibacterium moriokaense]|uniref:Uncharacterized protein n=1 Tax=Mycolicibacterium moriokaense TaxID=39691 RepID=A0A318H1A5_9MYCO|nr:hypothetical protein C8E89_1511 [Mycolicibacterium moriokaense]
MALGGVVGWPQCKPTGEHYLRVSKWLGHSSYALTLSTYADYVREDELAAPKVGRGVVCATSNVVDLQRQAR